MLLWDVWVGTLGPWDPGAVAPGVLELRDVLCGAFQSRYPMAGWLMFGKIPI